MFKETKVITFSPQYDTMKNDNRVSKMCCDGVIQYLEKRKGFYTYKRSTYMFRFE